MLPVFKLPKRFGFTEDHELLRSMARRLLGEKSPLTEVRKLIEDDTGFDRGLWKEIAELGWLGLVTAEEHGGAGLDYLSLALVLDEMGRALLPSPFFASVLAGIAIERTGDADQASRWCKAIATGESTGTVGLSEPNGSWDPSVVGATAEADGDGYRLNGTKNHVQWARVADVMVAPFRLGEEVVIFAVPLDGDGISIEPEVVVDSTRRCGRVTLENARVDGDARLARGDLSAWRGINIRGWALLAAEMTGAAQAILAKTCDYALERVQFNRPIGSFQAVKHPLVNVLIAIEGARSHVVSAAAMLDSTPESAELPARMAKAAAGDALSFAVDRGVQFHGGFGFTWDCDAHLYFKRSLWSSATLGDAHHHRKHVASALLGT
jgi:alkylation response protein AidB-like acyl-CoA dehydrogenase